MRASGGGRRGGARTLTPFVGREEELGLLLRRWERARVGEGQLVLIVGEPGLGKSRLIEEFHARLAETPHTWTEWSASQLLQNTPLHPIAEWGRLRFGGADATAEEALSPTLRLALRQVKIDADETTPLLAPLLDIPLRDGPFGRGCPPEEIAAPAAGSDDGRGFWRRARTQPVALAFEDLHWADPTSLDLMQALAERGAQAPLCWSSPRPGPEFRSPWAHAARTTARYRWRRSTAMKSARWSARSPRATRSRGMSSNGSANAPAACPCSSRK